MFKNVSIKMRLIVTLGIVGALLLVVGVMGIVGMRNVNERLEAMYHRDTEPTARIGHINRLLLRNRLAIANALINPAPAEIQKNTAEVEANIAEIAKTWDEYMAGPMGEQRRKLAGKFTEDRKKFVQDGLKPVIQMLRAGKIDAAKRHTAEVTRPTFAPVREGVDALTKFQVEAAKKRYAEAEHEATLMRNIAIAAIVIGLSLAGVMAWLLIRAITVPLAEAVRVAGRVANGELDNNIEIKSQDEVGKLLGALKAMNEKLVSVVTNVRLSSDSVGSAAKQIATGNADLSQRTQEQASALEETASSMEQMTSTVKQSADNARQANQLAASARDQAEKGGDVVSKAVSAMGEISDSSKKIADIIGVINEIAFQTNLLALNAAVEAARAGEQGRGFAVVATEVRNLAQRSAQAAKEIKELISDSVDKVKVGTALVDESGKTLSEIVAGVKKVSDIIAEIAASQEQSAGIDQVNKAVMQMDEVTQQNAALVEEAAAAAKSMEEQAQKMVEIMGFFRTGAHAAATAPAAAKAPAGATATVHPISKAGVRKKPEPAKEQSVAKAAAAPAPKPRPAKTGTGDGEWEEF